MNDPSIHTTKIRPLLDDLSKVLAPGQIKNFQEAYRLIAEINLRLAMANKELQRMESNAKVAA